VTSETYYPGWEATVDGRRTPIRPANLVMRAVPVPSGDHVLTFTNRPPAFRHGALLAALGLLVLITRSALFLRRKRPALADDHDES